MNDFKVVNYFIDYMRSTAWNLEASRQIFGDALGEHFWGRYAYYYDKYGAGEAIINLYLSMTNDNRELLLKAAYEYSYSVSYLAHFSCHRANEIEWETFDIICDSYEEYDKEMRKALADPKWSKYEQVYVVVSEFTKYRFSSYDMTCKTVAEYAKPPFCDKLQPIMEDSQLITCAAIDK